MKKVYISSVLFLLSGTCLAGPLTEHNNDENMPPHTPTKQVERVVVAPASPAESVHSLGSAFDGRLEEVAAQNAATMA